MLHKIRDRVAKGRFEHRSYLASLNNAQIVYSFSAVTAAQSGDDSGFIQRQIAQSFQFIHSITILKFIVCRAGYFVRKPLEFILPL